MAEERIYSHNLLDTLESLYASFSKRQKRVADYILHHPHKAACMNAHELSRHTGVSASTIIRFAKELGFNKYPAMLQALQGSLQSKLTTVERLTALDNLSSEEIFQLSFKTDIDNLRVTEGKNSPVLIDAVVDVMNRARRLYLVGSRASGPLIEFLNYYLGYMMDNLHLIRFDGSDVYTQMLGANEEDALLAISFPRYSSQTIDLMEYFVRVGGKSIAITDQPMSPAGLLADYTLVARCHMSSFVDSFVAPLALINLLIIKLGLRRRQLLIENFNKLEDVWKSHGVYAAERNWFLENEQ